MFTQFEESGIRRSAKIGVVTVPLYLFKKNGDMRNSKSKSDLKNTLQIQISIQH